MPKLRPFRDYDEKDVINLYAWSGSIPVNNGTIVKIVGDGFRSDVEPIEMLGNMGDFSVNNFVAQRYGVVPKVAIARGNDANTVPLGLLLHDVKELDENGIPLKYNPRKAAEMEVALSGQAVPIVTRGTFLYSGVVVSGGVAVTAGAKAYLGVNGDVATSGSVVVGKFLGQTGAAGSGLNGSDLSATALVWFNF
jgi:hypothetical protein